MFKQIKKALVCFLASDTSAISEKMIQGTLHSSGASFGNNDINHGCLLFFL